MVVAGEGLQGAHRPCQAQDVALQWVGMGLLQSCGLVTNSSNLIYSARADSDTLDAFFANSLPGGQGTARGFFFPKRATAGAGGRRMQLEQPRPPGAGSCSGRTEVLIKGAVLLLVPLPSRHTAKAALPASPREGAFPMGCTLTWLERAMNHAEAWHVWHYPVCLLAPGSLPKSATTAVLPLRFPPPSPPGQQVPQCLQQLPVAAAHPCSQVPPCAIGD